MLVEGKRFFLGNGSVEIFIPKNYDGKLLINVPHAGNDLVSIEHDGKMYKKTVGEKDVDILAKKAAEEVSAAYTIVYVPRNICDFARDPKLLGSGLKLRRHIFVNGERIKKMIEIHKNKEYYDLLIEYHRLIEDLNPRFIADYHGMANRKFDVILGFGRNFEYIGGRENAERFREEVVDELKRKEIELKIGIGRRKFAGSNEYILKSHVGEKNRKGVLVEFDRSLRYPETKEEAFEAAKAIARVAKRWA